MKKKMQAGGSLTEMNASTKRVGPVDPKGAWTKVQEKTLAGAKGKAILKKDKQLGATKMKMGGKVVKKAQDGSSLGMKSVKAGYDNNKGVTRADFVSMGKGEAKNGASMKKGGMMKKCKYGCK